MTKHGYGFQRRGPTAPLASEYMGTGPGIVFSQTYQVAFRAMSLRYSEGPGREVSFLYIIARLSTGAVQFTVVRLSPGITSVWLKKRGFALTATDRCCCYQVHS
jgi:hypothetical protein